MRRVAICAVALLIGPERVWAQSTSAESAAPFEVRVAGSESRFWLAQLGVARSRLHCRTVNGVFDEGRIIERRIASIAAADQFAYVFFQDNSLARYSATSQVPGLNLPGKQRPIHLAATADTLFALVDASVAASLPQPTSDDSSRPRDALSVVAYDGSRWKAIADIPGGIVVGDAPRLCAVAGSILLFSRSRDRDELICRRWELERGAWSDAEHISCDDPDSYWVVRVDGAPLVVAAWLGHQTSPRVAAYRRFKSEWRPLDLRLGAMPAGTSVHSYADAIGLGQRLALVAVDQAGASHLQYAAWQSESLPEAEPLSRPIRSDARNWTPQLRMVVMVLLVGVVASLFLFRRETIAQPVALVPGCELALLSQRVTAWLIDFVPFALAAAGATGLDWRSALAALVRWAFQLDDVRDRLPDASVLIWWGLSVGGFTLYCLLMELIAGRTIGKLMTGYRAISTGRARLTPAAALVRNACRLLELFPPFWILMFLAVLTRNRQRLGDIYAGTVAVRFRAASPDGEPRRSETRSDSNANDDDATPT